MLLAALTFMAYAAGTAHAGVEWRVAGQSLAALKIEEESFSAFASETFTLTIPWYATEIKCNGLSGEGTIIDPSQSEAVLNLSSCTLAGPPFVAETCKLIEPVTLTTKASLLLKAGNVYNLFEPAEAGKPLAVVQFKEKTECPLPLKNEVTGSFVAATEAGERIKQPFTFNSTIDALFPSDSLKFGGHPATLKGKAVLTLNGPFELEEWAAESTAASEFTMGTETFAERGVESEKISLEGAGVTMALPTPGYQFPCKGTTTGNGTVFQGGAVEMTILLSNCSFAGFKFCTMYATAADDEMQENAGKVQIVGVGELAFHKGQHYLVLAGTPFVTFFMGGELCSWSLLENWVFGSFAFKLSGALESLVQQPFEIADAKTRELLGVKLSYGKEVFTLDGSSMTASLSGKFAGKSWGAE